MKKNLVDSCGWLEYFTGGKNASSFETPIKDLKNLVVPTICLAEVFKIIYRERGRKTALLFIASMQKGEAVELDIPIALNAGKISVDHKLPLADSIILATARACDAKLWTQDKHLSEFSEVKYSKKS